MPKVEGSPKPARRALQEVVARRRRARGRPPTTEVDAMAFVGLGVTGGIGAYKAVEVARLLQKRGHDVQAVMTRTARRFVGPLTFEAITRAAGHHEPVRAGHERRHRAHRARVEHGPAARRAGHGQRHRQVRATASPTTFCRRCILATHAPVLIAPAMNTNMWEHPAVRGQRRHARRARRALRRSRRRLSRVRLGRQGPAGRAGGHRRSRRAAARAPRRRSPGGACSSPPARRSRISIRSGSSAIDRAAGWDLRSRARRTRAART